MARIYVGCLFIHKDISSQLDIEDHTLVRVLIQLIKHVYFQILNLTHVIFLYIFQELISTRVVNRVYLIELAWLMNHTYNTCNVDNLITTHISILKTHFDHWHVNLFRFKYYCLIWLQHVLMFIYMIGFTCVRVIGLYYK